MQVTQLIDKAARENEGSDKKPIVRLKVSAIDLCAVFKNVHCK